MNLSGKNVLVTGASRGIGKAIAQTLAEAGANVTGTATSTAGANLIGDYLKASGGSGHILNVTDQESIDTLLDDMKRKGDMPTV